VEALRRWVRQAERDAGKRPGLTTDERARLKQLEKENFELKCANEILRKASAFFTQPPGRYVAIAVGYLEPGEERDPDMLEA
jgi:transposase-like protein